VVGSQIANLTPGPSFGHNWCFRFLNGSCKPILDIHVSIAFQWYKFFFNPLSWRLQLLSKHSGVHRDSNSQGGSSLGSVRVHSLTLSFTPRLPLLARNLVSPYFGREPKVRVATTTFKQITNNCPLSKVILVLPGPTQLIDLIVPNYNHVIFKTLVKEITPCNCCRNP
jgi:hypothetical protein